jgi:hypothetical protein
MVSQWVQVQKVPKVILEEICGSMEYRDFPNILVIMKEEGFKLEKVDEPTKYGMTVYKMIEYFDQVKPDNPSFDYKKILSITYTVVLEGITYTTTVIDRINNRIPDLNSGSRNKLEGFNKSLIKRGALTAEQLKTDSKT